MVETNAFIRDSASPKKYSLNLIAIITTQNIFFIATDKQSLEILHHDKDQVLCNFSVFLALYNLSRVCGISWLSSLSPTLIKSKTFFAHLDWMICIYNTLIFLKVEAHCYSGLFWVPFGFFYLNFCYQNLTKFSVYFFYWFDAHVLNIICIYLLLILSIFFFKIWLLFLNSIAFPLIFSAFQLLFFSAIIAAYLRFDYWLLLKNQTRTHQH